MVQKLDLFIVLLKSPRKDLPFPNRLFFSSFLASCDAASFTYLESWKAISIANGIFGFNGWSSSVVDITPDFVRTRLLREKPRPATLSGRLFAGQSEAKSVTLLFL